MIAPALPPLRLVGGTPHVPQVSRGGSAHGGGPFVGVEAGLATLERASPGARSTAMGFGLRAGCEMASGVAVDARYDVTGLTIRTKNGVGPLRVGSVELRYSLPFLVVSPFAAAGFGVADASGARASGTLAFGLVVHLAPFASAELTGRGFAVDIDSSARVVLSGSAGLVVSF